MAAENLNQNNDFLLKVSGLNVSFQTEKGIVQAVSDLNYKIKPKEILGIAGESGCGKSAQALSLMRLIPVPPATVTGKIFYNRGKYSENLTKLSSQEMTKIRGKEIAMIFQDPMTALNPVFNVGDQVQEILDIHYGHQDKEHKQKVYDLFKEVGIPEPEKRMKQYPHEMSGGMLQRIVIAMAIACSPGLLIADEPTTALDVTVQAAVLELMLKLQNKYETSVIFISHDLTVISEMCDHIAVMYAGKFVEKAAANEIFTNPLHPYTRGLLNSMPKVQKKGRLEEIPGRVPELINMPKRCPFYSRCQSRMDICKNNIPKLMGNHSHQVRCFLHHKEHET